MSEATDDADGAPAKKGKLLLAAAVLALAAGGGGFLAVYSGLLSLPLAGGESAVAKDAAYGGEGSEHAGAGQASGPRAFVLLDPLVISLGPEARSEHLKVTLALEIAPGREAEITDVKPRLVDILQGFLRAVDEREFELPRSMERLRAQMLRRVRLVAPEGAVRDLLVQEFLLD